MRLEGKVAFISGGAGGMGAVEAKMFAEEGAKVAIGDLLETEGQQVEAEINELGGEALFIRLDVTSEADWQRAISATVTRFGKLDILVNNAGISGSIDPDPLSTEAWDKLMDVNAKGVFLSISGLVGQGSIHPGYNASKGAVRILTKAAAVQYAREGIRVNSVHPGLMPPMQSGRMADSNRRLMLEGVPMGREGRQEEVAYGVLYLASDESSYVTGSELVIDGGFTAQ